MVASLSIALPSLAGPAALGSRFADAYTAFAPLYSLYRSYADYLFYGTAVVIPPGVESSCQTLSQTLASLQMELIVQTGSKITEGITYLVHLRQSLASFCSTYRSTMSAIAAMSVPDISFLNQAADAGFFAAISDLNKLLGKAFDLTLNGLDGRDAQWEFSAGFAARTLLDQKQIKHIDPTLKQILLGSKDTPPPPAGLPDEIKKTLVALSSYAGEDLTPLEVEKVRELARTLYGYLVSWDGR